MAMRTSKYRPVLLMLCMALLSLSMVVFSSCVEKGCTDPNATNYDPDAEKDDGSCVYDDEPKYASLTIFRYGDCYEGAVDLYLNGSFQKSFTTYYGQSWPDCGSNGATAITYWLELGSYHFTAFSDSSNNWDFWVNLNAEDACYTVALKCGGIVEGDGVAYPSGTGNLTVWSSFDFGADLSVKVNGVYRGRVRDYSTTVPPCGETGSLSISNLTPGIYTIEAWNGTYHWNNYSVLVREGWCNSFELE
jgi:hypothetical protein